MIFKKTYFSREGSRGVQDEFKNDGFRASEFHGAFRERVFSFCWRRGGPLGAAKARVMANDNGHPRRILMVLLFVSSGFGGVRGGVKKSGLEPSRAQGALPKVCEQILGPKRRGIAHKNKILGVARRSVRGALKLEIDKIDFLFSTPGPRNGGGGLKRAARTPPGL